MLLWLRLAGLVALFAYCAAGQGGIAELARRAIAADPRMDADTLFRLQMAAEDWRGAASTLENLPDVTGRLAPFELVATARESGGGFDEAFRREFRDRLRKMDDRAAAGYLYWFVANVESARRDFERSKSGETIAMLKAYVFYATFRDIEPLTGALVMEDDQRRYSIQDDVLVKTRDGARIPVVVMRPKRASGKLPAAFQFTIYATPSMPDAARLAAAHGYAGVVGFTRGKRLSPDAVVPYEHDGDDAREVIDWIARQPWSDGRVGMFGGSYAGFTQWAAAKKPHAALKTIVPYVAAIPGLGLPMENNIFLNANYGWAFYVTDNKYLDDAVYSDPERWSSLNEKWFVSGRPYREIDQMDGTPNPWLQKWLRHPAFDAYWQSMVPWGREFSRIHIPVLTITGYYDDGQISALEYLKQHYRWNAKAEHYLLIGPWDHFGSQASRKPSTLREYAMDPVAQVDTPEVTFEWLDFVLRGGPRPALLRGRINYEEMGANEWRHAESLDAMHNEVLTLYLGSEKNDAYHTLAAERPRAVEFVEQTVNFTDRKQERNDYYPAPIFGKRLDLSGGALAFLTEPFESEMSVDGTFSGVLRAVVNKRDLDIGVVLYEMVPPGILFELSYFLGRASYARDLSLRRLLTPGRVEEIPFERTRLVSKRIRKGSRLLVVLDVNKNRFAQVNYGTGRDVSDESVAEGGVPLRVQWSNESFVRIPIRRP